MKSHRTIWFYLAVILLIVSVLVQETEARRKILRGRKALTKQHYRASAVPAWAISVIVGICMLVVGGIIYGVMRKMILSGDSDSGRMTYQPALSEEP